MSLPSTIPEAAEDRWGRLLRRYPGFRRNVERVQRVVQSPEIARHVLRGKAIWLWEIGSAAILDPIDRLRGRPDPILRAEAGVEPALGSRSVAIFIQYSASGVLSAMVRHQMEIYRRLGFAVVLVSNSPRFAEESWEAARETAAYLIHRRNEGLDFGAWKDVVPIAMARWPEAEELLLVNDSILGPIQPLEPVVAAMRDAGDGVFGLVESLQGGAHLQSWFTLVRGRGAIADLVGFFARFRLSRSKTRIIERGELRLAETMRAAGHRIVAHHEYAALLDMTVADARERDYLVASLPWWYWTGGTTPDAVRARMLERPLNPTHYLWRTLAGPAKGAFIKTELVRRNPCHLADVDGWAAFVPADSPCPDAMIRAHLAELGP